MPRSKILDQVIPGSNLPLVAGSGEITSPLFVCGEAWGENEAEEGIGFVGASGRMLWTALEHAGVHRHSAFVTNVVNDLPALKSGKPSVAQILAERGRLEVELAASQARVVLLVGGTALTAVSGIRKGITNLANYCLRPSDCRPVMRRRLVQTGVYATARKGKYTRGDPKFAYRSLAESPILPPHVEWLIPCLHPAGIMRSRFTTYPSLVAAAFKVGRALRGELKPITDVTYTEQFVPSWGTFVAWDIETGSIANDAPIVRLGVSDGETTWTGRPTPEVVEYVKTTFLNPLMVVICHNAAFDIPRLCDLVGLGLEQIRCTVRDTMLAAQLVCPDLPKGLEKAAPLYLDVTPWKDTSDWDNAAYNAKDAYTTALLDSKIDAVMGEQKDEYRAILAAMPVLWQATRRGLKVDRVAVDTWRPELEHRVTTCMAAWPGQVQDSCAYEPPAIGSQNQLVKFFYFQMRCPQQFGKEGQLTVDEAAIGEIMEARPEYAALCQTVLSYRRATRELSTWGGLTGERVHPQYLPASKEEQGPKGQGSATGRIQARDPNIMNLDRENRHIIIPDEGKVLGYVDWSQAEARVEALTFGDGVLMEAINADLHAFIGEKLGIDRVRAKNFWYGTGRGAGPRKLRAVMAANGFRDVSEADCRDFQARLKALFPRWARGREEMATLAGIKRIIRTPFGRTRRWYTRPGLPDVIGFYPQATVAGMLLRVLPELERVFGLEILAPLHDAVLFQCPISIKQETGERAVAIFQQIWPQIAPGFYVPADLKWGYNWLDMH